MYSGESLLPVWSNRDFEFIRADVRDAQAMRDAVRDVDAVVHLAAIVETQRARATPRWRGR